jgi:four helix bundle protein
MSSEGGDMRMENQEKPKNTELFILTKAYDMTKYGYQALQQFPKSEKYALAADIKKCMHNLIRLLITASKRYYKKTTLQDIDVEIMTLRHYVRLAHDLKFIPPKKYEVWSGLIVEIGKMLGGWLKTVKQ